MPKPCYNINFLLKSTLKPEEPEKYLKSGGHGALPGKQNTGYDSFLFNKTEVSAQSKG